MFYGAMVWDPWLIVSQIVCLQCLYYLALGLLMAVLVGTRVSHLSLLYLFDFATLTPRTPTGWCAIASFILTAIAGAGFMLYVIERAKKCLDFAATLYIIHLFICIIYGGWPASVTWWAVNIVGLAIMSLLGEYMCIRRELRDIPVSRLRASQRRIDDFQLVLCPKICLLICFFRNTKTRESCVVMRFTANTTHRTCKYFDVFMHDVPVEPTRENDIASEHSEFPPTEMGRRLNSHSMYGDKKKVAA